MARKNENALVVRGDLSVADLKAQAQASALRKKYGHLAQEDAHASEGASEGAPTISSDNLAWSLRGGETIGFARSDRGPGQEIPVIVLAHAFHNALMPGRYVKGQQPEIECAAASETLEGLAPPATWPREKRGAEKCQLCPHNAFGSGDNGKGKACRNASLLVVLPLHNADPADFNAKWIAKAALHRIFVSPTSMKSWAKYAATVVDEKKGAGLPLSGVVTLATVRPDDKNKQAVDFSVASTVPVGMMDAVLARRAEAREIALRPPQYVAPQATGAKPAGGKRVAPKKKR